MYSEHLQFFSSNSKIRRDEDRTLTLEFINKIINFLEKKLDNDLKTTDEIGMAYIYNPYYKEPLISIDGFLNCLHEHDRHSLLNYEGFIAMLIYIDQYKQLNDAVLHPFTIHMLVLAGLMLGNKYANDNATTTDKNGKILLNQWLADITRLQPTDISTIEHFFLADIQYKLYYDTEKFKEYENAVLNPELNQSILRV